MGIAIATSSVSINYDYLIPGNNFTETVALVCESANRLHEFIKITFVHMEQYGQLY